MKSSTSGCLAIFCVILLLITTSIYAGSTNGGSQKTRPTKNYAWDFENLYYLNCNISHKKFRCCNYANNLCVGTSFTNSLYSGCKLNLHSLKTLCFHCLTKMVILFHITDWLFLVTS
ncbi:unnamed protein product [Schistosoma rodhaini]|uniref:Uncharacterized protein n=1 Tax=Schistosoma rodhaini TaxID=6188 RepID=A0AA85FNL6_9TREM|nr:unnamed protein product [Schistosoma rodhaini]